MTDARVNDPDEVETGFASVSLAQEAPDGDRIASADYDDVDYEDENVLRSID